MSCRSAQHRDNVDQTGIPIHVGAGSSAGHMRCWRSSSSASSLHRSRRECSIHSRRECSTHFCTGRPSSRRPRLEPRWPTSPIARSELAIRVALPSSSRCSSAASRPGTGSKEACQFKASSHRGPSGFTGSRSCFRRRSAPRSATEWLVPTEAACASGTNMVH
jgi:hypothetical protein